MKLLRSLAAAFAALVVLMGLVRPSDAAPPQPSVVEPNPNRHPNQHISESGTNKIPSVVTSNGQVYVAWAVDRLAKVAQRAEASGTFNIQNLGDNAGDSDYSNAAIAVGSDGTLHYVWIVAQSQLLHRSKAPNGNWSEAHEIANRQPFANNVNVAVSGSSEVYVVWRNNAELAFARSVDGGVSWPQVGDVGGETSARAKPGLASGPNGAVWLTYGSAGGSILAGSWNGNNFALGVVQPGSRNAFNADPTIAVGPDNQPYLAWRCVNCGIFYAVRQQDATYGISRQFAEEAAGPVAIKVDRAANIHLAWSSGDVKYAVKTPTETFSNPVRVSPAGASGYKVNVDLAVSVQDTSTTAHIVYESFVGGQFIGYGRVQTTGIGEPCGTNGTGVTPGPELRNRIYLPMINNGAEGTC